ncbi:MAG: winged helix-turn-helix transcriptional regulator [Fibrobacteria bacterium]|nr:winged helix-turn-helix transcriptional regulator [Fibrobacteria bacterium]
MAKYENEITLEGLAEIASALGEPKRLMALAMLSRGERCLCDLTEGLGLSSSTVSNHMAILKRAGLVEARKDGRWMHFRLADSSSGSGAPQALAWVLDLLPESIKSSTCCAKDSCCP